MPLLAALLLCARAGAASPAHPWRLAPDELRSQSPRRIAIRLVRRLHALVDEAKPPSSPTGPQDRAEVVMMVPRQALPSIRKVGFLNAHQTGTSGGFRRPAERFLAEQELAMLRLPYDARGRQLLPKYALLARGKDSRDWLPPTRYGDALVVFKKEVRERATWTYTDTLDYDAQDGLLSLGPGNPTLARTFRYRTLAGDANACRNYCEVQIWGPLDWSDVDHVELSSAPASAADPEPAERNYLEGLARSRLSDGELIGKVEASTKAAQGGAFSEAALSTWELAVRPKTPAIAAELARAFASSDSQVRAAALYGLGELPWTDLKSLLLEALKDRAWPVLGQALAIAAEHHDDPGVKRGLDGLRDELAAPTAHHRPDELRLREWLTRADSR